MALSIGVKRGSRIAIGATRKGGRFIDGPKGKKLVDYTVEGGEVLEVLSVDDFDSIQISYKGESHTVSDKQRLRLESDVFVSCGLSNGKGMDEYGRLAFEAPRSVRIERLSRRSD